jgi:hypothetical protein
MSMSSISANCVVTGLMFVFLTISLTGPTDVVSLPSNSFMDFWAPDPTSCVYVCGMGGVVR